MKPTKILLFALSTTILLAVCKETTAAEESAATPKASEALSKVISTAPVGEPASIHQARATAKPGDTLTLKGRVMGNLKPFVDGRAVFILADPEKLTPCNATPDDACKTPWDTCCDTAEDIKANIATIQVVDGDGRVLKESIENVNGLKKLSTVIVSGTVAKGSNAALLLLNASSIDVIE
jgi:hypothetical protein